MLAIRAEPITRDVGPSSIAIWNGPFWHEEKNGTERLEDYSSRSNKSVWWKCRTCGGPYAQLIKVAMRIGTGLCQTCGRRNGNQKARRTKLLKSGNLLTTHPAIAMCWGGEKNGTRRPEHYSSGSRKSAWWTCRQCGSSYKQQIKIATGIGTGICQTCGSLTRSQNMRRTKLLKSGNLVTTHSAIALYWDEEKNAPLRPENVSAGSTDKAWWKCQQCNSSYEREIYETTKSAAVLCQTCGRQRGNQKALRTKLAKSGNLADSFPLLITEWSHRNALSPSQVFPRSGEKAWWICPVCNHEWRAVVASRTNGIGCPKCGVKRIGPALRKIALSKRGISFAQAYPDLLPDFERGNNEWDPYQLPPRSDLRVRWGCRFGHLWSTSVSNRTRTNGGTNCPYCPGGGTSRLELFLLCELRALYDEVFWRHKFGRWECDLFVPGLDLGIEIDGKFWHAKKYDSDLKKAKVLEEHVKYFIHVREDGLQPLGDTIRFKQNEPLLDIALRLLTRLYKLFPDDRIRDYLSDRQPRNLAAFNTLLARLPAPTSDQSAAQSLAVVNGWDFITNFPLRPEYFSLHSNHRITFVCDRGHRQVRSISKQAMLRGCCRQCRLADRSLAARFPEVAAHLCDPMTATRITCGSHKKLVWICVACSNRYARAVKDAVKGLGLCSKCRSRKRHSPRITVVKAATITQARVHQ